MFAILRRTLLLLAALLVVRPVSGQAFDTTAVVAVRHAFVAAVRAKDAAALAKLTTDDVVMLRGRGGTLPPVAGRASLQAFWSDGFARMSGPNPYALHPGALVLTATTATETGEFGADGSPPMGRYVFLFERTGDSWLVAYWKFYRMP